VAFNELDEEEDSVGFLAHPETVGRHHQGDLRIQVRTDSSFSRRATSVLEKPTGCRPGNLVRREFQLDGATGKYLLFSMWHRSATRPRVHMLDKNPLVLDVQEFGYRHRVAPPEVLSYVI